MKRKSKTTKELRTEIIKQALIFARTRTYSGMERAEYKLAKVALEFLAIQKQIGAAEYAARMAELADKYPDYLSRIEDETETKSEA